MKMSLIVIALVVAGCNLPPSTDNAPSIWSLPPSAADVRAIVQVRNEIRKEQADNKYWSRGCFYDDAVEADGKRVSKQDACAYFHRTWENVKVEKVTLQMKCAASLTACQAAIKIDQIAKVGDIE